MLTYGISVACVLHRRLNHPDMLPTARWSLGRWGIPVNILGLGYVSFVFFWSFWPDSKHVTPESFNWACVLFSSVFLFALGMYFVNGKKVYQGPVTGIRAVRLD
jgi:drug/metabolite transporter (DMT)-like permease